jgi:hypothetical protein
MARITVLLLVVPIAVWAAQASQNFSREVAYSGPKLQGEVYLCKSDHVASAGFRRDPETGAMKQVAEISKQKTITTWRIMLKGNQAEVAAFTGSTQVLEAAQQFSVTRGENSVLFTYSDRRPSIQAITIDLSNSSFVYSGQDSNHFMNKTNIFVGSCRPSF